MSRTATVGSLFLSLCLCAPISGPKGLASTQTDSTQATKTAIQTVLDDQVTAWNKGDLKEFMAGYWNSPDLSFFSGKDPKRGWEATYKRYRERYQAEGREMGKLSFSDLQIEPLGTTSSYVRGRWKLETSKEKLGGLFTLIFKKLPEGWRIVHDHTSG